MPKNPMRHTDKDAGTPPAGSGQSAPPEDPSPAGSADVPSAPPAGSGLPHASASPGSSAGAVPSLAAPADTPPAKSTGRARGTRADAAPRGPGRPSKSTQRVERIGTALTSIGMAVAIFQPADGVAVVQHSPTIAEALGALADENPKVAKFLDASTQANAWVGVAMAVAPLVITIASNHGIMPGAPALGTAQAPPDAPAQAPASGLNGAAAA